MVCVRILLRNAYAVAVASGTRPDLAAMLAPLLRELLAAEKPVLARNDLTMWGYVVLCALDRGAVRTQAALAQADLDLRRRTVGFVGDDQGSDHRSNHTWA